VSLNTVRSTLKTIFGKLAINRQSELARIVTRLEIPAGIDQ
jgi:DNA-binding CsgD family transcriptional regulator